MGAIIACCASCFASKQDPYTNEQISLIPKGSSHKLKSQTTIPLQEILREKKPVVNEKLDLPKQMRETKEQFLHLLTEDLTTYTSTSYPELLVRETDSRVTFRIAFTLPVPSKRVISALQDVESRKKWDMSLKLTEIVSQLDDIQVVYLEFQSTLGHSGTDLLTAVQTFTEPDETRLIISRSVVSPLYPNKVQVYRSNVTCAGFRIRELKERESKVDYVLEVQIGNEIRRAGTIETQIDSVRGLVKGLTEYVGTSPT